MLYVRNITHDNCRVSFSHSYFWRDLDHLAQLLYDDEVFVLGPLHDEMMEDLLQGGCYK